MRIIKLKNIFLTLLTLTLSQVYACNSTTESNTQKEEKSSQIDSIKINIIVGSDTLKATLGNNPTAKDFIKLLPLTLNLEDYANMEKIFYPEQKLSTEDAPTTIVPKTGDITYYEPWGDVAIFYKDFRNSPGLIKIGHIDNGIEALQLSGSIENVRFELIEKK